MERNNTNMAIDEIQEELNDIVTTQLLDNGMEILALKINRIIQKLQQMQSVNTTNLKKKEMKYALQLQQLYGIAYQLLLNHHAKISHTIHSLEYELKNGSFDTYENVMTPRGNIIKRKEIIDRRITLETSIPSGQHVAAKVARSHELWILARVITFHVNTQMYEVEDADKEQENENNRRHHFVDENQVVALPGDTMDSNEWIQYGVNQRVMALYPKTTSFYRATICVPNPKGAPYVILQFEDDADEFGHVPERKVPFRYVAPLPARNELKNRPINAITHPFG